MDGNHKLIRWGLVVHSCIDGFSRACIFLKCSNNNRSTTVFQHFLDACEEFDVPLRVRTDHGGENMLIWKGMLALANEQNVNPVMVGSSVHNQRVERFNRDINVHIRSRFGCLFYSFERNGILDIENKYHMAALHLVFMPRINTVLKALKISHNNHPIRTEANTTPIQLIERFHHLYESHDGIINCDRTTNANDIPQDPLTVSVDPPDFDVSRLDDYLSTVDVCADDGEDGKQIYLQVKARLLEEVDRH